MVTQILVQKVNNKINTNKETHKAPRFIIAFCNKFKSISKIEKPKPPYNVKINVIENTSHANIKTKICVILPLVPNKENHPENNE